MSLVDFTNTTVSSKVKQHEIVTRPGSIKLKVGGTNFYSWSEESANHCSTMGSASALKPGSTAEAPGAAHEIFSAESSLLPSYGRVSLDEAFALSTKRRAGSTTAGEVEQLKGKCLIRATDEELRSCLTLNTGATFAVAT